MAHYPFKLVDHRIVSDYGAHNLADEADAKSEPIKLARSLRASRPEFIGLNYSISVPDETGAGVCIIPLHVEQFEQRGLTSSAGRRAQSPYDQPCQKDRFSLWRHLIQGRQNMLLRRLRTIYFLNSTFAAQPTSNYRHVPIAAKRKRSVQ
jgi:hypothetical protein